MVTTARRREAGAVLIHVAIAIIGLLAFSAFAVDYGVLWVSRRQAQNSADAAALAGATSLAYARPGDEAAAVTAAVATGQTNFVWGEAPVVVAQVIDCPNGRHEALERCVRADVYRTNDANVGAANPLPTFFARLVGVTEQGVRATATAQVAEGAWVECLKPWAIPDKWWDEVDTTPAIDVDNWTFDDYYDRYTWDNQEKMFKKKPGPLIDAYFKHGAPDIDTDMGKNRKSPGFSVKDRGIPVTLKVGNPATNDKPVEASWFFRLDLDGGGTNMYRHWIANCYREPYGIDVPGIEDDPYSYANSLPGNANVPTRQAVEELVLKDPDAYWDSTTNTVKGSRFPTSPRLVPIPVISIEDYLHNFLATGQDAGVQGRFSLPIVNILGFFVEPYEKGDSQNSLRGVLYGPYPAKIGSGQNGPQGSASMLRTVMLIR